MNKYKVKAGDNMELLKKIPDNSIDAILTDPPYGLSFMNKKWDYEVPSVEFWREAYRVLKPGGHILSFSGTRTYHRAVVNIEDAGFEIRDQLMWLYGSGFPKSLNIGKAVDKLQGNEREVVGFNKNKSDFSSDILKKQGSMMLNKNAPTKDLDLTKGSSPYEGYGTGLKPANEPICLARKPIAEKTIAENVIKWRTGGINIDGCRISTDDKLQKLVHQDGCNRVLYDSEARENGKKIELVDSGEGRFPANILFDEKAAELLDTQQQGVSRFFYVAKVSKKERNLGLDNFREQKVKTNISGLDDKPRLDGSIRTTPTRKNTHPTVKPINLLYYLAKLITPKGGTILDPFAGSGSTGIAALLAGFNFIGCELDEEYVKIAEERIKNYELYRELLKNP